MCTPVEKQVECQSMAYFLNVKSPPPQLILGKGKSIRVFVYVLARTYPFYDVSCMCVPSVLYYSLICSTYSQMWN